MKRRDFLKALAASSVLTICPRLNASDIESLDKTLKEEPLLFNVEGSQGELSLANYWNPPSRGSAYELNLEDFSTKEEVESLSWNYTWLRQEIYGASQYLTPDKELDDYDEEGVSEYIKKLSDKEFQSFSEKFKAWLDGEPDYHDDFETAPYNHEMTIPLSGHAAAFRLFSGGGEYEQSEIAELLNIEVVEGEHFMSTYYAAELRISVDEANEIAQKHDIPMRFTKI